MENFIRDLVLQAGDICLVEQSKLSPNDVSFKSRKDLVTITDLKVEQFIIDKITARFPDHAIIGEETGFTQTRSDFCWIIDPIDGTSSYYHQQPFFSVSIALKHKNETILGAVFAPVLDQLFLANEDEAFLNGKSISVSASDQLDQSMMATGFACLRANIKHNNLPYFNALVPRLRDIRRFGSAALDLCYVGCGRLDGFWEMNLNIYDVAAGILIVEKAGGVVSDFNGGVNYPREGVIASNPLLHPKIASVFNQVHNDLKRTR